MKVIVSRLNLDGFQWTVQCLRALSFTTSLLCVAVFGAQPKLNEVILEWGNRELHAAETFSPWLPEHQIGSNAFVVSNATVLAFDAARRLVRWTASISGTQQLRWIAAGEEIAYFRVAPKDAGRVSSEVEPKLQRLDLITGKWLSDLRISGSKKEELVIDAVARKGVVVVLTGSTTGDHWSPTLKTYRVSGFAEPGGRRIWNASFSALAEVEPPAAFLWSAKRPNEAVPTIRHFSWLGDDLLVCAGPRQNLIRLGAYNGEIRWSVERIWEFKRGFIGPSVWSHFISRFGSEASQFDKTNIDSAARERFDQRWQCQIIGGPILVHRSPSKWGPDGGTCIFVAVAKAAKEEKSAPWGSYLSDCVVYELNDSGEPLSMVNLPRIVDGSRCFEIPDAAIWNCQNNSIVKLQASDQESLRELGPGAPDRITRISWYREFDGTEPNAWLVVNKVGEPVSFAKAHLFRVLSGGYVTKSSAQTFNLPLAMLDYEDGRAQQMVLRVPLTGVVPLPATNISSSGDSHRTIGPYFLAITQLRASRGKLAITLGMEGWSGVVTFNLPEAQ